MNNSNSDYHYVTLNDGRRAFLLFTDDEFKCIYGGTSQLNPEEYKVVSLFTYDDIREFFSDQPGLCAVINANCGSFSLTPELISEFDSVALNQAALQRSANFHGDIAPMTGFFQNNDF